MSITLLFRNSPHLRDKDLFYFFASIQVPSIQTDDSALQNIELQNKLQNLETENKELRTKIRTLESRVSELSKTAKSTGQMC